MVLGELVASLLLGQPNGDGARSILTLLPLVFIGVLFYLMVLRPERQKQSTHKQMLTDLKKNDRVITAGGIKGIVTNIQRDADEVTINVDESSGTKIRVTLASIARVVTADAKGDSKKT